MAEQLDSFASQTHKDWVVWASDDGSTDLTLDMLDSYKRNWAPEQLTVLPGPRKGFVSNFLSLTCNPDIRADMYAYSDQDDIWEKDKLQRAVDVIAKVPSAMPALYCSRTQLINEADEPIGYSPLFRRKPSFANALTQNVGGGNTMVFNDAARQLLMAAGPHADAVAHDWWVYLVISACGGVLHYDSYPSLRYRQHGRNLIGANASFGARLTRIRMLMEGDLKSWNDRHIEALKVLEPRFTAENLLTFERFKKARQLSLVPRVLGLKRSGIYRQTTLGNVGLLAAAIFNKV